MDTSWLDLGPMDDLPEGQPVLRKVGGRRFACVRIGGEVHAIDDVCPHQGYPLSQGTTRDCILTCEWHNWKFDVTTGDCLFGGEAVRRYPTRVDSGTIQVSIATDPAVEAARLRDGLSKALRRDEVGRALREALRLGEQVAHPAAAALGPLAAGFEAIALDGAVRAEYGFDHGLAMFADLVAWSERGWVGAEDAFVAAAHSIAEPSLHLDARVVTQAAPPDVLEPGGVDRALLAERREEAEARVRAIVRERGHEAAIAALIPFVARHFYDYGHSAIYAAKAAEIATRFPAIAGDVFGALAASIAWATAETALPPFASTRAALEKLEAMPLANPARDWQLDERAAYETAVLSGEAAAVKATVAALDRGLGAIPILRAAAHAAAERMARFDDAWESRVDAEITILDVTHMVTFAESALALASCTQPRDQMRLAVIAAGMVGKVKKADRRDPADPSPRSGATDLIEAVAARDAGAAIAIARAMDREERLASYQLLAPFAAFEAATRPIFYAHTIKNTEALHRLDRDDASGGATYLVALLGYMVPPRRELRVRRIAHVARKFLADQRPPEGLY